MRPAPKERDPSTVAQHRPPKMGMQPKSCNVQGAPQLPALNAGNCLFHFVYNKLKFAELCLACGVHHLSQDFKRQFLVALNQQDSA